MKYPNVITTAAVALCLVGCNTEKSEARRFCKILNKQASQLDAINSQEATVIQSLQTWAGQEAFMGGGSGRAQASQNALNFKSQLASLRTRLSSLSQELTSTQLTTPYIQTARSGIVQSLDGRSRLMGELDPLLEDYARGIINPNLGFGMRPSSIDTIVAKVRSYQSPSNNIAQTLQELRAKYSISDSELATEVATEAVPQHNEAQQRAQTARDVARRSSASPPPPAAHQPAKEPDVSEGAPTRPYATASSELAPQGNNKYSADRVIDGQLSTAWVEGKPGPGIGEWVEVGFPDFRLVSKIRIFPGYGKSDLAFRSNNRPRTLRLQFTSGEPQVITLEDAMKWQTFTLTTPVRTFSVRTFIIDVYRGSKWDDTAISEIEFQ
jgi:hypothetical protein